MAQGIDVGAYDGTSFSGSDRELLPNAHDMSSLLDVFVLPAIYLQHGGASHAALEPLRYSAYGRSWKSWHWYINGFDVTDPMDSGIPMITAPWQSWQSASCNFLKHLYNEQIGCNVSLFQPKEGLTMYAQAGFLDQTGGPTFIPPNFMDGEPAEDRGAPRERRMLIQAPLYESGLQWCHGETCIKADIERHQRDRTFITMDEEDYGLRWRGLLGYQTAISNVHFGSHFLFETLDRDVLGAENRLDYLDTTTQDAVTYHLQNWMDITSSIGLVKLGYGYTYREENRSANGAYHYLDITRWRNDNGVSPFSGDSIRRTSQLWVQYFPSQLPGKFSAGYRWNEVHWHPEAFQYHFTNYGQSLWYETWENNALLQYNINNSHISYDVDHTFRWGKFSAAAGIRHYLARVQEQDRTPFAWLNPVARAHVTITKIKGISIDFGATADCTELPFEALLYADRTANNGTRYFWFDDDGNGMASSEELGSILQRWGGDHHTIDENLKMPREWEMYVGFSGSFSRRWRWTAQIVQRWYTNRLRIDMTSTNGYTPVVVQEPGGDGRGETLALDGSGQDLVAYNKDPSVWGQEEYVLTNETTPSFYQGLELQLKGFGKRWFFSIAGIAYRIVGKTPFGNNSDYNDLQAIDLYSADPNWQELSEGRTASDRALGLNILWGLLIFNNINWGRLTFTSTTRYRDGEPYSRHYIFYGLDQGPVILQAVSQGAPRYTFHMTWDMRLRYSLFRWQPFRIDLIADVFNFLDSHAEITEQAMTGGDFRKALEMMPPRTYMLSIRISYN